MTPSNDELLTLCTTLGKHAISTSEMLLSTMQGYETLAKSVYAKLPDLGNAQRDELYKLSAKGQKNIKQLEDHLKQLREALGHCLN